MEKGATNAVRPLDTVPRSPEKPPSGSMFVLAVVLLTGGVLIGWVGGSVVAPTSVPTQILVTPVVTPSPADAGSHGVAELSWRQSAVLPAPLDGYGPAYPASAVDLDGTMYLNVVAFAESEPGFGGSVRSALWESTDGDAWREIGLNLGEEFTITDVDVYKGGLLLSGVADGRVVLWRSTPNRAIGPDSWSRVDLGPAPGQVYSSFGFKGVSTAVDADDEIVTAAQVPLDIATVIFDPLLPPGVSLDDPRYQLELPDSRRVRDTETGTMVLALDEAPELVSHDGELWVRIVDAAGVEHLTVVPLGPGVRVVQLDSRGLFGISAETMWQSDDGVRFDPVATAQRPDDFLALPATPFRSGFVGGTADDEGNVELWTSASGSHWSPLGWRVPAECRIGFPGFVIAGEHIVFLAAGSDRVCEVANGSWSVTSIDDAAGQFSLLAGGDGGLALATRADFGTPASVDTSADGRRWDRANAPGGDGALVGVFVVDDRVLLVTAPASPTSGDVAIYVANLGR